MKSPSEKSGMRSRIKVGVVGAGYLGRLHARIYAAMPAVELIGVVDIDPLTAATIANEHGCEAYTQASSLLGRVQAVSIVVPTLSHADVARPFLQAGIHSLIEKPIASTLAEGRELIVLAEKSGAILQIGHLERFNAGIMELAARVKQPRFLEAHRLGIFVNRGTDVDVVTDLMIHDIDIIMSLVKSGIRSIAADGIKVITDQVDIANARIEFDNGAVANVTASRISTKKLRRIRVFGSDCYYGLDCIDQKLEMAYAIPDEAGGNWPRIVSESLEVIPHPPLQAELAHFINAIQSGTPPLVDGRIGLEALRVAFLIKERIAT